MSVRLRSITSFESVPRFPILPSFSFTLDLQARSNQRAFFCETYARVKVPQVVDFRTSTATLSGGRYYSLASHVPADDTTPDQFTFTDQVGVVASATITSAAVTVAGLGTGVSATFTVTGSGGIDKNASGVYAASQSLQNGDTFRAQHTASGSALSAISTTVTCNGVTDTFTSTTADGASGALFESSIPLEVIMPKAAGSALVGLDSSNRVFKAVSGKPYRIPLCAIGGKFPYEEWTTTLGTIESYTDEKGETQYFLEVANPTGNFAYSVTVDDGTNTASSGTVNVVIVTAEYVDGDNVAGGRVGTEANPWNSLAELKTNSVGNGIVYFRECATPYNTTGLVSGQTTGVPYANGEERVDWSNTNESVIWLAYPGEAPVIDFGYAGSGYPYNTGDSKPRFRMTGPNVWVEGLEVRNAMVMAFQVSRSGRRGAMFWRNKFYDCGPGIDGGNSAFIMWLSLYGGGGIPNTQAYGDCVISNLFDNDNITGNGVGPMITYSMLKPLFEGNKFTNFHGTAAHFAQKADVTLITFRGNVGGTEADPMAYGFYGGNQDTHNDGEESSGDLCFNLCWATVAGTEKVSDIGYFNCRRNTIIGPVRVGGQSADPYNGTITADGPYTIRDNVIQNAQGAGAPWPYITDLLITDYDRVDVANNTVGASGVVDSDGNLTVAYVADVGTRGHQRGA
jgi:hypothetical protein